MEAKQQIQDKRFILIVALVQGLALLLMHNWVIGIADLGRSYQLILPLYAVIVALPLSLMMLANQPRQLVVKLTLGFSIIAACCAAYIGHVSYSKGLGDYAYYGMCWILGGCIFVAWFITLAFFEHYCQYQHWFSRYEALFSFAWRNAVKVIVAGIFVGLFWGALGILGELFKVLGIAFFSELFSNRHFVYPATTLAFGLGLSLYAAKEEVLSEFKSAILQVIGWLLPLVSFILLAFIITLPLKGLSTLWDTGYATSLMLSLLGLAVFLLNTAFQDGRQIHYPVWLLKLSNAGLLTMPLYALLCMYAVYLRVHQYGWTQDRVWAASFVVMMAIYSFGYAFAAIKSLKVTQGWMHLTKTINIFAAFVLVAMLVLINSPLLNPTRIAVHSQLARLLEGKVKASQFDFQYLRFKGGTYGNDALQAMLLDKGNPELKAYALAALDEANLNYYSPPEKKINSVADLEAQFTIYPQGQSLESSFYEVLLADKKAGTLFLDCLSVVSQQSSGCRALVIDLNADNVPEVVVFNPYGNRVYAKEGSAWRYTADMKISNYGEAKSKDELALLESGDYKAIKPKWNQFQFGKDTFSIEAK